MAAGDFLPFSPSSFKLALRWVTGVNLKTAVEGGEGGHCSGAARQWKAEGGQVVTVLMLRLQGLFDTSAH